MLEYSPDALLPLLEDPSDTGGLLYELELLGMTELDELVVVLKLVDGALVVGAEATFGPATFCPLASHGTAMRAKKLTR